MATFDIDIEVPIPTGQMLYVDQTYGSDSGPTIGLRNRFDRPFLTPEAAWAAAMAGDLIHVGPGDYAVEENLAKNGVHWYFEQGSEIVLDGAVQDQLFSDESGAMTFSVGGYGTLINRSTATDNDLIDTVRITNASSNVTIICSAIINERTSETFSTRSAVRQTAGTLRITCDRIVGIKAIGLWWDDGDGYIECPYIAGEQAGSGPAIYTTATETATGKWWINTSNVICEDVDNNEAIQLNGHADTEARVWINAEEVRGELIGITLSGGWNYLNFMKISGGFKALQITGGGHNWLDCQKINGGELGPDFLISVNPSSGEHYVKLHNCSEAGATSAIANLNSSAAAVVDVSLGDTRVTSANITGVQIGSTGGSLRLQNTNIYNTVAGTTGSPLAFIGGTEPIDINNVNVYALSGNDGVISNTTSVLRSTASKTDGPLGTGVTAEGDLFYDDGTDPSGKVATGNANGSWSWAAPTGGGGAVDSVNGQTGTVSLDAADVGADPAGSAAAAQAAAIAASPAETVTTIGALINGATAKTTPVDADMIGLMDSAASNVLKKLSWANIKATLKTYFDTLYSPTALTIRTYAGTTDALVIGDAGNMVRGNNAAGNVITVPLNATVAFPVGSQVLVSQYGAGQTSFTPEGGVTINSGGAALKIAIRYGCAVLTKTGVNEWNLEGNLAI